ncbi:hypothetical protein CPB84DRAFT_1636453, partial [Gymnopilus junonius]
LVSRSAEHVFAADDFNMFEHHSFEFLHTNRRGRIALMSGGIMWRLAMQHVSWSSILNGPSGWSPNCAEFLLAKDLKTGLEYMDDDLTETEVEQLCGIYHCLTGNGDQIAKRSWFPLPDTFDGSGYDYGEWTEFSENWFR